MLGVWLEKLMIEVDMCLEGLLKSLEFVETFG